jgi:hypothetical protein
MAHLENAEFGRGDAVLLDDISEVTVPTGSIVLCFCVLFVARFTASERLDLFVQFEGISAL